MNVGKVRVLDPDSPSLPPRGDFEDWCAERLWASDIPGWDELRVNLKQTGLPHIAVVCTRDSHDDELHVSHLLDANEDPYVSIVWGGE